MKNYILIISIVLFFSFCKKEDEYPQDKYPHSYPCCMQEKIDYILGNPPQNPRATIGKYYYKNQYIYVLNTNYPDAEIPVYNENCEILCSSGGIAGNTNDSCENWEDAEFIETVWTDNR